MLQIARAERKQLAPAAQNCAHDDQCDRQISAIHEDICPGPPFEKRNNAEAHGDPTETGEKACHRSHASVVFGSFKNIAKLKAITRLNTNAVMKIFAPAAGRSLGKLFARFQAP